LGLGLSLAERTLGERLTMEQNVRGEMVAFDTKAQRTSR